MKLKELDEKLRQLNDIEKELLGVYRGTDSNFRSDKLKDYFSSKLVNGNWVINSEKLMKTSEVISIHRHDRFTKFEKHNHDFLEMTFVYSGSIHQTIEGKELEIKKGEIILLDMNVEHSLEEAEAEDIAINVLIKKEFFDWMFLSQIAYNDLISNFIVKAIYGKGDIKQYIHFRTSENDRVWDFMIQMLTEYYEQRNGMETAIRAYMLLLFNELLRDYEKYLSSKMIYKIDATISTEIVSYINSNYKDLNLKTMSEYFNYNPDYIGKLVKKTTGRNLKDLVREQRMKQAEYLLKNTDMAVVDIVSEVGYSNVTYFYKQFREEFGITPDEYRKNMKSGF
jgi:AraC family transcriptional regulator, dual regulator of chb operon